MRVTVLGCGGSGGVPLATGKPGGEWGVCDPLEPRNRRRRVSLLVEEGAEAILIDTSPDLREQIIAFGIARVSAVLYTHAHADHCHGLDELRALRYRQGAPIPTYMDWATQRNLVDKFGYIFTSASDNDPLYKPLMDDRLFDGPFQVGDVPVLPFTQEHGDMPSIGFRIGPVAYSTDVKDLDEAAFAVLEGVKLWVVDCLRDQPHPTHSHTAQTLEWIARVKPDLALLTHLNHQIDYRDLKGRCPAGVEPAYDGQVIEL